jgi:hypothetical protein
LMLTMRCTMSGNLCFACECQEIYAARVRKIMR